MDALTLTRPAGVLPSAPALAAVRSLVVFRALMLGDLLAATPALRALRAGCPQARITLVGLPWARELAARLPAIDAFIEFPGFPGLPERTPQHERIWHFFDSVQRRRFDLAVQLHGSGSLVTPLVCAFGAARTAGFHEPGQEQELPERALFRPWPGAGTEVERLLALTDHLGLPRRGTRLDFPLHAEDRAAVHRRWTALQRGRYAVVHTGAQLPSRRWAAGRFLQVAQGLVERGLRVVWTGSAAERDVTGALAAALPGSLDLAGCTSLWELGAVVEGAHLLVSNDSGPSHVAAAVGTASVVVASGSDVARWAPADARRHRVLWHATACRPCGWRDCPTGHECADAMTVDRVLLAVDELLALQP